MPDTHSITFAGRSTVIRQSLEALRPWIDGCLGAPEEVAQLRFNYSLASVAVSYLLGSECRTSLATKVNLAIQGRLQRVEFPPGMSPAAKVYQKTSMDRGRTWWADWLDCPVALYLSGLSAPVISVRVTFVEGSRTDWREVTLVRREDIPRLLELLHDTDAQESMLHIVGDEAVPIQPLSWDDLVMDDRTARLIRNDFELHLGRKQWYRDHSLPFRRGYLLHGPPGNGKSSIIRAMLSSHGMSGFTINPFRSFVDDDLLATLFRQAAEAVPAMVILEDLDRWFVSASNDHAAAHFSLQQVLNHLDGVGNQDGIIVVATANNPRALDPAILRRPGRFDRVVELADPSADLRERYLRRLHAPECMESMAQGVAATAGFSFAQVRETYILAAQTAYEEDVPLDDPMLARAGKMLSDTMRGADRKWNQAAGFSEAKSTGR